MGFNSTPPSSSVDLSAVDENIVFDVAAPKVKSKDQTGATNSENVVVSSGTTVDGNTGTVTIKAETPSGDGVRGNVAAQGKTLVFAADDVAAMEGPTRVNLSTDGDIEIYPWSNVAPNLKIYEATGTYGVKIKASSSLAADCTLTLPVNDGDASQVLTTDGGGVLSWATPSSGANTTLSNLTTTVAVNQNFAPDTNGTRQLGSLSFNWSSFYFRNAFMRNSGGSATALQLQSSGQTSPSGTKSHTTINNSEVGLGLTYYTVNTTGSTASGALDFETGNTADGASGNINLRNGIPTGSGVAGRVVCTGQGLQIVPTGSRPTAAVGLRGTIFVTQGGAGVADVVEICVKGADDNYSWVAL